MHAIPYIFSHLLGNVFSPPPTVHTCKALQESLALSSHVRDITDHNKLDAITTRMSVAMGSQGRENGQTLKLLNTLTSPPKQSSDVMSVVKDRKWISG